MHPRQLYYNVVTLLSELYTPARQRECAQVSTVIRVRA